MNSLEFEQRKTFGVYEAALGSLLFIIFNFAFLFLFGLLPYDVRSLDVVYYIASFFIEFLFAVAAFTVAKSRNISLYEATGMKKKINAKIVGLSFVIAIVCLLGFSDLTSVFMQFLSLCGYRSILSGIEIDTFWKYLIYIVTTCITPAICEDMLFRGVICSGLKGYGKKVAIVVSAVIFMLMHGNAEQTVHQFIIGLVLGYIFIESGNLWIGVLVHFFNNFISITEAYILGIIARSLEDVVVPEEIPTVTISSTTAWLSLLFSLVIAVIVAVIAFYIIRYLIKSVVKESDKINTAKAESNATILVDGAETDVSMTIDGETMNEFEELKQPNSAAAQKTNEEKPQMSVATIIMFALSGAYLIFDWITALLQGLGVI